MKFEISGFTVLPRPPLDGPGKYEYKLLNLRSSGNQNYQSFRWQMESTDSRGEGGGRRVAPAPAGYVAVGGGGGVHYDFFVKFVFEIVVAQQTRTRC